MRYFLITLFICALIFTEAFINTAIAQRHTGYCDQANSTADALECVNKHDHDTQEKLNLLFKVIANTQDEQTKSTLNIAQKNWIAYRDTHCEWEANLAESPSLKRVYELSCLAEMTEKRIKLLELVQKREKENAPREFSTQPRWMNALALDYPEIFWRYGEWKSTDMNCDGEDEQIMTGMSIVHIQDSVTIEDNAVTEGTHHDVEIIIAVSDNPETGRPKAKLLRLPISDKYVGEKTHLCRPAIHLEITEHEQDSGDQDSNPTCAQALKITDKKCEPLIIYWDGKDYILKTAPVKSKGNTL